MTHNSLILFFLLFLVLCAGCGCSWLDQPEDLGSDIPIPIGYSCAPCGCQAVKQWLEIQTQPKISSSSPFQDDSTMNLILQCNPAPGCDPYSSELIFSNNVTVLYNSAFKRENLMTENGAVRINATSIRFPSQNHHLSNLTCAYNNLLSSNSLDIPYLNIDKLQVSSSQLGFDQTSTVSCKVAMKQSPENYTVRFLFEKISHFEFKHSNGEISWFNVPDLDFPNKVELRRAGHLIVSDYPVYSAIFAIEVTNNGYEHYENRQFGRYSSKESHLLSPIQCELQYGDNQQLTVRSKQYSISILSN